MSSRLIDCRRIISARSYGIQRPLETSHQKCGQLPPGPAPAALLLLGLSCLTIGRPRVSLVVRPQEDASMTREALTAHINPLADAVLDDWRWVRDDLNVSILGMLLYGFARANARGMRLSVPDVDAAVLQCMTERVGAAAKWSGALVAEANASADDQGHHPGHHELIGVGQTYHGVADLLVLVNNVFANFASVRRRAGVPEPIITVFLNPLVMLLASRERQKGSPLT